ncbi:MAG: hypothetical protein K8W52_24850 [Deltaproteobacteria bacterium]|nr:hypothetical protein [Deltaproteobacteria bacterium]
MSVADLIDRPDTDIHAIARHLDALDAATRAREVLGLGRAQQRALYEKAAASRPIDLAFFVGDAGPRREVIHDGMNTLPVPPPFRKFQKRFCKSEVATRLYGYNEGITRRAIGPGYFVAIPTAGRPAWEARGAVVVDYFQVPEGPVADGWPRVVPNDWRLSRFVYHQTRDFMRRVSAHVSVGAAFKVEKPLDHYFVLCRQA